MAGPEMNAVTVPRVINTSILALPRATFFAAEMRVSFPAQNIAGIAKRISPTLYTVMFGHAIPKNISGIIQTIIGMVKPHEIHILFFASLNFLCSSSIV